MQERAAVMLSDSPDGMTIADQLSRDSCRVACYTSLEQLFAAHPPASIPVLIFHLYRRPRGNLLVVIGRLAVEHPGIQKVAVTLAPLSLEVAEYLAACGVDLVPMEPDGPDPTHLASLVRQMHERRQRCLAAL